MDKALLQYFIAKAGTTQKSLAKELNVTPVWGSCVLKWVSDCTGLR